VFATINENKLLRYLFPVLFFIPVYFFTNSLSIGVQWSLVRYQATFSFGTSIYPIGSDLYYILSGIIAGKSAVAGFFLIISAMVLVVAFLLAMANRARESGIFTLLSGVLAMSSCFVQYGYSLQSPAGMCIPFGVLFYFLYGILLYRAIPDPDGENLLKKYDTLFVLAGIFVVYMNFTTGTYPNDTIGTQLLPYYMLHDHTLYLDQATYFIKEDSFRFVDVGNGHYVSLFPIVTAVLITPLYIIPVLLDFPMDNLLMLVMTHVSASLISAIAAMIVYLICKRITTRKISLISVGIFAFATSTWSISSQTLYAHGMVELLLALMLFLIIKNEEQQSDRYVIALGALTGLFIFNRPSDALLVIPIVLYVLWYYLTKTGYYFLSGFITGLPFLIYNMVFFHNPLGGYSQVISRLMFDTTTLSNFIGLLIAPNKGLFVFSPVLLFAIIGYWLIKNSQKPFHRVVLWSILPIALTMLIYASFDDWMGGNLYGPRYLTSLLPYLMIGVCIFLDDFSKKPQNVLITAIIIALIVISVFIQFVGVFYYGESGRPPADGYNRYSSYDPWDWENSIILDKLFQRYDKTTNTRLMPINRTPVSMLNNTLSDPQMNQ